MKGKKPLRTISYTVGVDGRTVLINYNTETFLAFKKKPIIPRFNYTHDL